MHECLCHFISLYSDIVNLDYYAESQSGILGVCPRLQAVWTQILGHKFTTQWSSRDFTSNLLNGPPRILTHISGVRWLTPWTAKPSRHPIYGKNKAIIQFQLLQLGVYCWHFLSEKQCNKLFSVSTTSYLLLTFLTCTNCSTNKLCKSSMCSLFQTYKLDNK